MSARAVTLFRNVTARTLARLSGRDVHKTGPEPERPCLLLMKLARAHFQTGERYIQTVRHELVDRDFSAAPLPSLDSSATVLR